jgi:hypothetical protein
MVPERKAVTEERLREILHDAAKLIGPPADDVKNCRFLVSYCIETLRGRRLGREVWWSDVLAAQRKYVKHLRAALKQANRPPYPAFASERFLEYYLPNEIRRIEQGNETLAHEPKQPGRPRKDRCAQVAADTARRLLELWKQPPNLTKDGEWHQLSDLIYEAVTGQSKSTWKYCREWRGFNYYDAGAAGIDWTAATKDFDPSEHRIAVQEHPNIFLT